MRPAVRRAKSTHGGGKATAPARRVPATTGRPRPRGPSRVVLDFARDGASVRRKGRTLEVWLSARPDPAASSDVTDNARIALGQLRGNVGEQACAIPSGRDLSANRSVVILCERFGVLFSPAALQTAS